MSAPKNTGTVNAGKEKHPGPKTGVLMMTRNIREECLGSPQNVEMGGIEPPSDVVLSGLLRAQFASDFLGPGHAANSWPIRAQSSKSPVHPDDGGKQQWLSK